MSRFAICLFATVFAAGVAYSADEAPTTRSITDRQIIDGLAKIHDRGASLFNSGDARGCYRFFQGSLQTVKLVLPKELQDRVELGLSLADREPDVARRALALHELIEDVRKKLHPTAGKNEVLPKPRTVPTINDDSSQRLPGVPKLSNDDRVVEAPKRNETPTKPPESPKLIELPSKPPESPKLVDLPAKPPESPKLNDSPSKPLDLPKPPDSPMKLTDIPKLTSVPKSQNEPMDAPKLGTLSNPEPPKAPTVPPGKLPLDPPPPVSGVPSTNPKPTNPMPPPPPNDPTIPDTLTIPPRPIDPPAVNPKLPVEPTPNKNASPLPAPPSGPELEIPPVSTLPPRSKNEPPPPLKVPK